MKKWKLVSDANNQGLLGAAASGPLARRDHTRKPKRRRRYGLAGVAVAAGAAAAGAGAPPASFGVER